MPVEFQLIPVYPAESQEADQPEIREGWHRLVQFKGFISCSTKADHPSENDRVVEVDEGEIASWFPEREAVRVVRILNRQIHPIPTQPLEVLL